MDSRNHHPAKFLHGNVNKLIATRNGDSRQKIIEPSFDRKNELYSRFGDRLVLKQDYSEKLTKVADKADRQTKQDQLDPATDDKWGHDRYDGRSKSKTIRRSEDSDGKYKSISFSNSNILEVEEIKTHKEAKVDQNKVLVRNLPTEITKSQVQAIFGR